PDPLTNGRRQLLSKSVLISGGAGFIGSALSRRLVNAGYDVAVMDVLHPQVHAAGQAIDLPESVRLFTGDVTHAPDWDAVLRVVWSRADRPPGRRDRDRAVAFRGAPPRLGQRGGYHPASRCLEPLGPGTRAAGAGVIACRLRRGCMAKRRRSVLSAAAQPRTT